MADDGKPVALNTAAMLADAEQVEAETRTVNDARAAVGVEACGGIVEQSVRLAAHVKALVAEAERLRAEVKDQSERRETVIAQRDCLRKSLTAADAELSTLRERVAALEAGLRPFAEMLPAIASATDDLWPLTDELDRSVNWPATEVKCGHVRRAAALLDPEGGK